MKTLQIVLTVLIAFFLFISDGFAFRCGNGLVTSGDTKVQVTVTCGNPTSKETVCEENLTTTDIDKQGKIKKSRKCANKVQVWYYNCGESDYIYALTFEDNKLIKENTIGRGQGKSDCLGK